MIIKSHFAQNFTARYQNPIAFTGGGLSSGFLTSAIIPQTNVKIKKSEFQTEQETGLDEAWKAIKEGDKFYKQGKGTYRDAREFTERCGFPDGAEQRFGAMLAFRDVYK